MIRFTRGILTSTAVTINTAKSASLSASRAWNINPIRSLSDVQKCPSCGAVINVAHFLYKKALLESNTYAEVRNLAGSCQAIKDDTFSNKTHCVASETLRIVNNDLDPTLQINVEYYDKETTEVIMSAFLKRDDLEEGESDLTGDSGTLALRMLAERVQEFKGYIVDIGGQDQSFVR